MGMTSVHSQPRSSSTGSLDSHHTDLSDVDHYHYGNHDVNMNKKLDDLAHVDVVGLGSDEVMVCG